MKKLFVSLLSFVISLAVLAGAVPVFAAKPVMMGPAEKATGKFWAQSTSSLVYLDFNAHEAKGNRPAKGEIHWYRDHPVHGPRDLYMDVKYVNVCGEYAYIAGYCWEDTAGVQTGKWLYMYVKDGGTPGRKGDKLWARWYNDEASARTAVETKSTSYWVQYDLVEGNLVVHTSKRSWDLTGSWILDFDSTKWPSGNPYQHDMDVSDDTATGGWPTGAPYTNSWTATVTVDCESVEIHATYKPGSGVYPYEFWAVGVIASDGTLSGTWTDTLGDSGTWLSTSGAATWG